MRNKKFGGFAPVSKQSWIDQAQKDLKGGDFEQRLVTDTPEGFSVFPFYTSADVRGLEWIKDYDNRLNPPPPVPESPPRYWANAVVVEGVDEKALNADIRYALGQGADGLILDLSGKEDFQAVFQDVLLPYIQIWIRPKENPRTSLEAFFKWISLASLPFEQVKGGLLWMGLAEAFDHRINREKHLDEAFYLHEISKPFPYFRSCCLDTTVYHHAGAHAVQEIGYGLSATVELMDGFTERGADPSAVFSDLFLYTAVGSSYFMEIAKLKTLRICFQQLASLYRAGLKPEDLPIFTCSSSWTKSPVETYHNIIRNTTEAMSAVIGGCNILQVIPHDSCIKSPDQFSKRMARNISSILKEESHLDKVIDPSAGSYLMENLIHSLREHAVQLLKTVEQEGGWWKVYLKNQMQKDIKEVRNNRLKKLKGETSPVGFNSTENETAQGPARKKSKIEDEYQLKSWNRFIQ